MKTQQIREKLLTTPQLPAGARKRAINRDSPPETLIYTTVNPYSQTSPLPFLSHSQPLSRAHTSVAPPAGQELPCLWIPWTHALK